MVLPYQLIHSSPTILASIYPYSLCAVWISFSDSSITEREREVVLMIMDDSINGGGTEQLVCRNHLQEGIILLLSHWYALQMALKNHWGGSDSLQKFHQLAADLFSLFSKSNAPVPVDDLENLLHESMLLSFNTEIEDGSIEEVAEQLVAIHEEYLLHQSS